MTSDGTTTWVYGGNNRATQAGAASFLVNALGQRVRKATASSATRFVYDEAGRLWGEYADDGTMVEETVWLGDLPVATLRPNGAATDIFYVHPDPLGTPRLVTRPSDNAVVWRWDNTEPFGNSAPDENPSGVGQFAYNLRFPGQYYDSETGTNYNYFRDYDPNIGRYVESDPIGIKADLDTYAYVLGNPFVYADRFGLMGSRSDKGIDRAIDLLKKVCKKDDENCQDYAKRIYRACVSGPLPLNGPACKLVSDHFAESCILNEPGVTCPKPLACGIPNGRSGFGFGMGTGLL